jgi:hypothetical protein
MGRTRKQTPFDKIMEVRSRLNLYVEYGDHALAGQTFPEFAADVAEAFNTLMDFRNMVNSMASLNETPQQAALQHIDRADAVQFFSEE